jgi:hypothetical protein
VVGDNPASNSIEPGQPAIACRDISQPSPRDEEDIFSSVERLLTPQPTKEIRQDIPVVMLVELPKRCLVVIPIHGVVPSCLSL